VTRVYSPLPPQAPEDQDLPAELEGMQALLFVLEAQQPSASYWARQRQRLQSARAAASSAVDAPLVLVHFHQDVSSADLEAQLGVKGTHALAIDPESLEQTAAASEAALIRSIRWLAARTATQPEIVAADLRTIIEGRLELAAQQCFELCTRLAPQVDSPLPAFISVYNTELERLGTQLADPRWQRLSWPAPEFVAMELPDDQLPPVGWNSPQAQSDVLTLLKSLVLPPFDPRNPKDR
jgi:hypothetical protein